MKRELTAGDRVAVDGCVLIPEFIFLGTDETLYPDSLWKKADRAWIKDPIGGAVYTTQICKLCWLGGQHG